MRRFLTLIALFFSVEPNYALFSDKENAELPSLFHLDDYNRCLLRKGGLYCLGEFDLAPLGTSRVYEHIKKYSADVLAFNRSRLYRGYCVSERCPQQTTIAATNRSASQLFEQCVDQRTRRYALSARLRTLKYCISHQEHMEQANQPTDGAQQLFLQLVYALLVLNIVGTLYDVATGDEMKNSLMAAWSLRANWRRLTATYDHGDPRLKQLEPIHGMRVVAMLLTMYCHAWIQQFQFYVTAPQNLEMLLRRFDGIILASGTSIMQAFTMISNFLTAYNMLIYSEKHRLSLLMLPALIVKRIIRIAPVHLLAVGFAATFWPAMRPGANSHVIGEYSSTCRQKFWTHVFFLNNVVDKQDICLMPSWFLPVDMHLFIVSCALTIVMSRWRHRALRLYAAVFVMSAMLCGVVAYISGWQTIAYISTSENVRGLFRNTPSFVEFYTTSWSSLPACLMGLFCAHLHYDLQQRKYDWNRLRWFKRLYMWIVPGAIALTHLIGTFREYKQSWVTGLCVAVDRPLLICLYAALLIGVCNFKGTQQKFFGWRGWRVPSRLSLPVMLCHWIISVAIAARPVAYYTSVFDVSIDFLAIAFYGYAVSIPVALLVEIPVQRLFAQIL